MLLWRFIWAESNHKLYAEIKADLEKVYGDSALKKSGICKWIRWFRERCDTVKDDPKSGHPSTSVTDKVIADVQQHVKQDRRVTVREIAETFSISYGSAHEVLTDKLRMSGVCARWVPRLLTTEQMGVQVEICSEFLERVRADESEFTDGIVTCNETHAMGTLLRAWI